MRRNGAVGLAQRLLLDEALELVAQLVEHVTRLDPQEGQHRAGQVVLVGRVAGARQQRRQQVRRLDLEETSLVRQALGVPADLLQTTRRSRVDVRRAATTHRTQRPERVGDVVRPDVEVAPDAQHHRVVRSHQPDEQVLDVDVVALRRLGVELRGAHDLDRGMAKPEIIHDSPNSGPNCVPETYECLVDKDNVCKRTLKSENLFLLYHNFFNFYSVSTTFLVIRGMLP